MGLQMIRGLAGSMGRLEGIRGVAGSARGAWGDSKGLVESMGGWGIGGITQPMVGT